MYETPNRLSGDVIAISGAAAATGGASGAIDVFRRYPAPIGAFRYQIYCCWMDPYEQVALQRHYFR